MRVVPALVLAILAFPARGASSDNTLMRYPTLHGNTIVFVAHDNLWSVQRSGGAASRLTADPGRDLMPRFSPDGRWIAFPGDDSPADWMRGHDVQLEAAISYLLGELQKKPVTLPPPPPVLPAYPKGQGAG